MIYHPMTLEEISDAVEASERLIIRGVADSSDCDAAIDNLTMGRYNGIVDWTPEDQVVVVRAGTLLHQLQTELASKGQCLPIASEGVQPSLGGAISANFPHSMQSDYGSWRDWILGMTVILADGSVRNCGSRAVKNVAGYDVQKLFVGARGTLAVVADVVLRTYPIKSVRFAQLSAGIHVSPFQAEITDPVMIKYMKRAKEIFDPTHKLNPGEMGIF